MSERYEWIGDVLHMFNGLDSAISDNGNRDFGHTVSGALLEGGGTASSRLTTSTANKRFFSFYLENAATSGDNRGVYLRFYLGGAGGGGEALRAFTSIDDVAAGTAHGAHISLGFETSGSITGLGVGCRMTLHVVNSAVSGGTYAAAQSEIYTDGASSDITGATEHSVHRFIVDGAGKANHENWFSFVGANATSVKTGAIGGTTKGIRILIDGTVYYIAVGTTCA